MPMWGCHPVTSLAGSHQPAAPQRPHTLEAAVLRKAALWQARSPGSWGGSWVQIWEMTQPHLGMGVTEKTPLPKHQDTKGWRSGSGGQAGCQRAEKNCLDEAVGTRRRRRVPRDRGGGHCRVSQAPSPPALHPRGLRVWPCSGTKPHGLAGSGSAPNACPGAACHVPTPQGDRMAQHPVHTPPVLGWGPLWGQACSTHPAQGVPPVPHLHILPRGLGPLWGCGCRTNLS